MTSNFRIFDPVEDLVTGVYDGDIIVQPGSKFIQPTPPTNPSDVTNKIYVDTLLASGGTFGGDIIMTAPAKIVQCQAPVNPCDVANKAYVDAQGGGGGGPFLPLVGGTMTGPILQSAAPTVNDALANKLYVDTQVATATIPDANATTKGKIQLAGDLTGTAAAPVVASNAIGNLKLANMSNIKKIKGSNNSVPNVTDLGVGPGLDIDGNNLVLNPANAQKAGDTQFGVIEFDITGDLTETSLNSGIAKVKNKAIINDKLADMNDLKKIKGSNNTSLSVIDLGVGPGLDIDGNNLVLNPANAQKAGDTQFGVIEFDITGDLTETSPNSGIAKVKNKAIINDKLADMNGLKKVKGSNSSSVATIDLTVGSGLDVVSNTLQVNPSTAQRAGNAQFGVVEFDPTGDLIDNGTNTGIADVRPNAITNAKMANMNATKKIKGSNELVPEVTDLGIGGGLDIVSGVLVLDTANPLKAGVTQFGLVEFDLGGDLDETSPNSGIAKVRANAITNAKMADMASNKKVKGSAGTGSTAVDDLNVGNGVTIVGTTLQVDTATLPVIPVAKGGTGATTLTGYLKGTGTTPVTTTTSIPVADVNGAVGSVNGIFPVPLNGGNVSVLIGSTSTGLLVNLPTPPGIPPIVDGDIYVVSGDIPANNGRTYIYDGTAWFEVTSNLAATDARYVQLAGSTMNAAATLTFPATSKIILTDAPTGGTDAANKAYVDAQVVSGAPDATAVLKGKVQLAGDLAGASSTASTPRITNNAVTNGKMAVMSGIKQLKGSNDSVPAVTDLTIGPGLTIDATSLNVDTSNLSSIFLPLAGGTMTGPILQSAAPTVNDELANKLYVDNQVAAATIPDASTITKGKIQLAGDLAGTAAVPLVASNAITNAKLANMGAIKQLKGSNGGSTAVTDLTIGTSLTLTGNTLDVNSSILAKADDSTFGTVKFDVSGDLIQTGVGSGIATIRPNKVSYAKIQQVSGAKKLLGSETAATNVAEIGLGAGLDMVGSNIVLDSTTAPKAGALQFGQVQFNTTSGDLVESSANSGIGQIGTNKVLYAKIQQVAGAKKILGSQTATTNVSEIGLGAGLDMVGSNIVLDPANAQKAGTTQFGVIEFDPTGDLVQTAANSGIGQIGTNKVLYAKMQQVVGAKKILGSQTATTNVSEIGLGAGLDMVGSNIVLDSTTAPKAGASQFGVIEFNTTSGDLVESSANSGIAKLKPTTGTGQLKGSAQSSSVVTDITLGSGLSLTGSTLSATAVTPPNAGNTQLGLVQFDTTGDLVQTAANSGIANIGLNKVTYTKMQQAAPSTLIGTPSTNGNPGNYAAITLGPSMSMVGSALNAGVSFVAGPDPNITAPTDRPSTTNVLYIGNNASAWIWNGTTYIIQTSGLVPTIGPWISEPTTITGFFSNPTKGVTDFDYIKYRAINSKEYMIEFLYSQTTSTGASDGSGSYFFKLPTGLTFNSSVYNYYSGNGGGGNVGNYTNVSRSNRAMKQFYGTITTAGSLADVYVIPYDATRFRIWGFAGVRFADSGNYQLNQGASPLCYSVQFILEVP
jgi:hypothetical protein